jgi:hypothetical protein
LDLTESIAPKSDQLNADDLIAGPVTVTVSEVSKGTDEQPVNVNLVEFPGRPYKPSKSMRRVMVLAWGSDASAYAGRRLTIYRNPEITFGRDKVGGIEISHLSHLAKPLTVSLTATRGKRKSFTVQPLPDAPAPVLAPGEIPELVVTNAAKAAANGTTDEYLAYLTERGAPAFILEYVTNSKEVTA